MQNDLFSIKGETIVVTGGLGQIGSSYCQALGEYEANIVILDSSGLQIEFSGQASIRLISKHSRPTYITYC